MQSKLATESRARSIPWRHIAMVRNISTWSKNTGNMVLKVEKVLRFFSDLNLYHNSFSTYY